jgi:hypothetical protein
VRGAAQLLGVEVGVIDTRDPSEIERGVAAFARSPNGGLIVMTGARASAYGDLIIALAEQYKLPAIYPFRYHASRGGLIYYGSDYVEAFRPAAGYVDRILKGEKPADLPVQAPAKIRTGNQPEDCQSTRPQRTERTNWTRRRGNRMRRREFIMLLGGVVAGWPLPARAQRMEKMPQIGYLGVSSLSLEPHYIEAFPTEAPRSRPC